MRQQKKFIEFRLSYIKTQRRKDTELFLFFFEHKMHERNEGLRLFCVFRVHVILTTDIQDLTDFHHERKRDNPFNLCYLCSNK